MNSSLNHSIEKQRMGMGLVLTGIILVNLRSIFYTFLWEFLVLDEAFGYDSFETYNHFMDIFRPASSIAIIAPIFTIGLLMFLFGQTTTKGKTGAILLLSGFIILHFALQVTMCFIDTFNLYNPICVIAEFIIGIGAILLASRYSGLIFLSILYFSTATFESVYILIDQGIIEPSHTIYNSLNIILSIISYLITFGWIKVFLKNFTRENRVEEYKASARYLFTGALLVALLPIISGIIGIGSYTESLTDSMMEIIDDPWSTLTLSASEYATFFLSIIAYSFLFISMKRYAQALSHKSDTAEVMRLRSGIIILLICGLVSTLLGVIGWIMSFIAVIIAYVQILKGSNRLRHSETMPQKAAKGFGRIHACYVWTLIAELLSILPFVEGIISLFVFFFMLSGWAKVKNSSISRTTF